MHEEEGGERELNPSIGVGRTPFYVLLLLSFFCVNTNHHKLCTKHKCIVPQRVLIHIYICMYVQGPVSTEKKRTYDTAVVSTRQWCDCCT